MDVTVDISQNPSQQIQNIMADAPEALAGILSLIQSNDIDQVITKFQHRKAKVEQALKEWNIASHDIMDRLDKVVGGKVVKQWKLPIAYQKKIFQSSVAFLFGKPVKLKQDSDGTDVAFNYLLDLRKKMRMPAKDAENARLMKSETESAKLFVEYRDPDLSPEELSKAGVVSVKCILLAKSKGDTLYTLFDIYGVMRAFARGYQTKLDGRVVDHFDVYTAKTTFFCAKTDGRWLVTPKVNLIGKIQVAYYWQEWQEWYDVQQLIERREMLTSRRADNNDYAGDAILVLKGDVESLPGKDEVGKTIQISENGDASYLYPQMAIDMVKEEKEDIRHLIHYLTDTPDLSMDNQATLGQDSGKALEMRFFGAILKAMGQHEYFQEMIDREVSILKAFMSKIIWTRDAVTIDKLEISVEFGNPLPDNIEDTIAMLTTAVAGKPVMSQATAVKLNPLVTDAESEILAVQEEDISSDPNKI